ncbi:F-box-like [Haematococcus lacustris]|uniref:F-box-like n=1 Tax=Haematococcus lacustris TaxID=44745 RepID=A0A699Z8B2_HAELA|nr:F-box-like [Haematococcus lacustris]
MTADVMERSGFQMLPDGVALHILSSLRPRQVAACGPVCKSFAELCRAPCLWQALWERDLAPKKLLPAVRCEPTTTSRRRFRLP